eukprot:8419860-Pyramimonas_sp.AAC.1
MVVHGMYARAYNVGLRREKVTLTGIDEKEEGDGQTENKTHGGNMAMPAQLRSLQTSGPQVETFLDR